MTCPPELELAMHADGALPADVAALTDAHLPLCEACRTRLGALRAESMVLTLALAQDLAARPRAISGRAEVPTALSLAAATVALAPALIAPALALAGVAPPAALDWINPFSAWGCVDLTLRAAMFLAQHGDAIVTSLTESAAAAVLLGLVLLLAARLRRRAAAHIVLATLCCAIVAQSLPAQALEIRRKDHGSVLIPASVTIADTLVVLGDSVEVNGNVEGDLIAFGRRVIVRGRVDGLVFAAASTLRVDGTVAGSVIGMGQTVTIAAGRIGRNLFSVGTTVEIGQGAGVGQNAVVAAQHVNLNGRIGRDALAFGAEVEVGNTIAGTLTAYAQRVAVLSTGRIAGNLEAHVERADMVSISPGAIVGGRVSTELLARPDEANEYLTARFYLIELLHIVAALVTGLILLTLVPGLRRVSINTPGTALVSGGIGLLALVATPIIALLLAVTIIGIPIAALGLMCWLAGLYLGNVLLGHVVGAQLLAAAGSRRHFAVALTLGLVLISVAGNLPYVGDVLQLLLRMAGLGLLVRVLWHALVPPLHADEAWV